MEREIGTIRVAGYFQLLGRLRWVTQRRTERSDGLAQSISLLVAGRLGQQ